jgi:hypothetical protein
LELTVDELKAMVARTKGYFVRDWSLYLGWNNVSLRIHSYHPILANFFSFARCDTSSRLPCYRPICWEELLSCLHSFIPGLASTICE